MGKFQTQYQAERSPYDMQELYGSNVLVADGIDYLEGSAKSRSIGGEVWLQPINESDSSTGLCSQRQGKRRDVRQRWTRKVTSHLSANPDSPLRGPLDDGFSWRKYGQKDILGSKFPRGYYRCTFRKSYGCLATKQVQRMDDDPNVFEVTCRGSHTCHKLSTVPSIGPLPVADQISPDVTQLSMDSLGSGSLITVGRLPSVADQISSDVTKLLMDSPGRGSFMTVGSGSSSGVGLSSAQSSKEVDFTVDNLADYMSYSDGSSSNSMDFNDFLAQSPEDNK